MIVYIEMVVQQGKPCDLEYIRRIFVSKEAARKSGLIEEEIEYLEAYEVIE